MDSLVTRLCPLPDFLFDFPTGPSKPAIIGQWDASFIKTESSRKP